MSLRRAGVSLLALLLALAMAIPAAAAPVVRERPTGADLPSVLRTNRLIVGYRAGFRPAAMARSLGATDRRPLSPLADRTVVLAFPDRAAASAALRLLRADPRVRFAEPDERIQVDRLRADGPRIASATVADDPFLPALWGMHGSRTNPAEPFGSGAVSVWAQGWTGSDQVYVGILDEGVMWEHHDLTGNAFLNPFETVNGLDDDGNGYIDDIRGWDFYGDDNDVFDPGPGVPIPQDAHGTHVAGTIGGVGDNQKGVVGINWNVTFIPAKFIGPYGGTTADAVAALDYITDMKVRHGLKIVATNNSWSGGGGSQALFEAINRAGDAGILFVAAAGNGAGDGVGDDNDTTPTYPGSYSCTTRADNGADRGWDCVLAVAAIDAEGAKAPWSNYGAQRVDLAAPGREILSTVPTDSGTASYDFYEGTSMATPHVTGAIALCASIGPSLSPAELRSRLLSTTAATASMAGRTVTGGRLDMLAYAYA